MKVFLDTSSLLKRYIQEAGSDELEGLLGSTEQITVASTFLIEANAALERRYREKDIAKEEKIFLKNALKEDADFFMFVELDGHIKQIAIELIERYPLVTLDAIQLASACKAKTDMFITSDKQLFKYAQKELKHVRLI